MQTFVVLVYVDLGERIVLRHSDAVQAANLEEAKDTVGRSFHAGHPTMKASDILLRGRTAGERPAGWADTDNDY